MAPFYRFCVALRKPVDVFVYLLGFVYLCASGSFKVFLHQWRWLFVAVIAAALVVQIVGLLTRKLGLQGIAHA